jgi:RimJ/RimL family protein N-acetyltransferase
MQNGSIIAGVLFDDWNGATIRMHVAAEEGKRWMTKEYLRVCFYYPFVQLKVHKIIGLVCSSNMQARKFDEHLGFVREATISGATSKGDLLIYTMTREQCRFLEIRNGRKILSTTTP